MKTVGYTDMTTQNGRWCSRKMKDFGASLVCTHYRSRPNRTGFSSVTVSNQTYFSVVYAFDYNNRNDLQFLQMMQEMT